jgi:hypothetical protein
MLFGELAIPSDDLVQTLCRRVRERVNSYPQNPPASIWTAIVAQVLHEIGDNLHYDVYCKHVDKCHEWLLDAIWWRKESDEAQTGIALAVECEWDYRDLMWDFQKLLCIKAPVKLFIYDGGNVLEHGNTVVRSLGMSVQAQIEGEMGRYPYHVEGETYLFVSFGNTGEYAQRFVVPSNGRIDAVELEPVPLAHIAAARV